MNSFGILFMIMFLFLIYYFITRSLILKPASA